MTQYKFKSRRLDYIIIVLLLLAAGVFAYARLEGARIATQEGIVTRRAVPSILFLGERLDVELRLDDSSLPRCALPPSADAPVYAIMVMDTSGSMLGSPLADAQAAATEFVDLLDMDVDRVALIEFGDDARILSNGFTTTREDIMHSIDQLSAGNGTNMGAGLQYTYDLTQETAIPANAMHLIILLSDGMPNVGADPQLIAQRIREETPFRIVAVALGDADQAYLGTLVENPDEDVLVSSDPTELLTVFGEIAQRYVNVLATDIVVDERYNTDAFEIVSSSVRTANTSQVGTVAWSWPFLGERGRNAGYQLRPIRMGTYAVVNTPGQMSLIDCTGQSLSQSLPGGPLVLVLFPLWVFVILGLLGLLWLLYRFLEESRFGKIFIGPVAPLSLLPPPPLSLKRPTNKGSPTGDWHGKTDI